MFLNEVALGKENHVFCNQSHLKSAPAGYDSVLAVGRTEPGKFCIEICIDLYSQTSVAQTSLFEPLRVNLALKASRWGGVSCSRCQILRSQVQILLEGEFSS